MNLSPLMTEIRQYCNSYDHQLDEAESYNLDYLPSYTKFEKDLINIVEKHGFKTYSSFEEELLRRVSPQWVHNNMPQLLMVSRIDF